jgi:hypothetical protein
VSTEGLEATREEALMRSLGAAHLLVFGLFVVLVLDSRRLHTLARLTGRGRRDPLVRQGIPSGSHAEQVGIPLRLIQMRIHVDWQDGGLGWDGPEILEVDECDDGPAGDDTAGPPRPGPSLPVLWKPFPALLPAGATGNWLQPETPELVTSGSPIG